jgi:hypothetical protein
MRKSLLIFGVALAFLAVSAPTSLAQVVDNFQAPDQGGGGGTDYLTVNTSSSTFVQGGVDAIGGTRVYYGQRISGTDSIQLGISGTQMFRMVQNPVSQGRAKLLYGYSAVNTASLDANNYTSGHTLANLNANVSASDGLLLDFGSGGTATITVTLISGSEGTAQVANVTLPAVAGSNTLLFPNLAFLANNPNINFSDIDQVVVSLDGLPNSTNAALDNIFFAAVPEPAVLAMGSLGFVGVSAMVYRRVTTRRRRREMAKLAKLVK